MNCKTLLPKSIHYSQRSNMYSELDINQYPLTTEKLKGVNVTFLRNFHKPYRRSYLEFTLLPLENQIDQISEKLKNYTCNINGPYAFFI